MLLLVSFFLPVARALPQVAEIEEAEKEKMRNKCKKIIDHGVNVFVNRQLIYNFPEQVRSFAFSLSGIGIGGRGKERRTKQQALRLVEREDEAEREWGKTS